MAPVLKLPNLKVAEPKKIIESIKNYIKLQPCSAIALAQVTWVLQDNVFLMNSLRIDSKLITVINLSC